ncbi:MULTISPECIES: P-loop NTPase fold protein [Leptolyngbya]|uniref:P-loop NTPase fold protein n=1 Tax=Leptolyngbya TaxID=47251 RepID=UPI001688722B|nr:P-loop NTPase fold protein [Leptolyngbya sp. FACHB-1624]MBD1854109.1 AAA family ATPase [Leptolyngbya sp. FACHB-1624]
MDDYRAKTLKEAFRLCNIDPLSGAGLERYYVDLSSVRKTEAIEGVNFVLDSQYPGEFCTILFTGHRGCGKSTELKRICHQWEQDYRVIYLEANDETDINDAEYTDFYLVVIKQVEFALREMGLSFDKRLLKGFEDWFKDVTKENEQTVESSVSVESEASLGSGAPFIAKLLVKLLAQIKGADKQKTVIRQTLQRDISRLKADINLLLQDAYQKIKSQYSKGFLVIFDNLDRVPPEVGNHLFFDYAAQLQELNCTIIYTVPISVLCSSKNIVNTFGEPHVVSMVRTYQLVRERCELDYDAEGLKQLQQIIEKRVDTELLFESEQEVLALAKASGGHVRQLMQMVRSACQTASTRKHAKIQAEDVEYAIKQQQFHFERFVRDEHYPLLAKVCLTKNVTKDETGQLMLFNTSVLEYNGLDRWNYPNPAVRQSALFQTALRELLTQNAGAD